METIKKQTIRFGNSAGVLLPKEWLNSVVEVKLVRASYSKARILKDLSKYLEDYFENILGIFLIGSYARGDYDEESDIDILVITDNINKIINKENYEIFLISEDNLEKKLPKSLYLISAIKEIKPIINKRLLEKFKDIKARLNIKDYEKEIKRILKINKAMIDTAEESNQKILDGTAYSLVLRFRELYLLKCILYNKIPDKKEFLNLVGRDIFSAYLRVKRNKEEINNVSVKDAKSVYELSLKWLKELKEQKQELKV